MRPITITNKYHIFPHEIVFIIPNMISWVGHNNQSETTNKLQPVIKICPKLLKYNHYNDYVRQKSISHTFNIYTLHSLGITNYILQRLKNCFPFIIHWGIFYIRISYPYCSHNCNCNLQQLKHTLEITTISIYKPIFHHLDYWIQLHFPWMESQVMTIGEESLGVGGY